MQKMFMVNVKLLAYKKYVFTGNVFGDFLMKRPIIHLALL